MSEPHSSPDWYRVAEARPAMRRDAVVVRHVYLGRPWFVLTDPTSGKVHRLTPAAYAVAGRLDGTQTVATIWQDVQTALGEDAPSQQEVVQLLGQLHAADLLESAETPLLRDLLERRDRERAQLWKKMLLNPLAATVPLVDPDRFLQLLVRIMSPVPRALWWLGALAVVMVALALLPLHWEALSDRGLEGFLDLENLLLIALIYPVVKAVHELGHGVVTRARGGEVHEMGLMFVAFYPIPYVEASSALAFPSKWARAAVAAAGVVVELVIAALAFLLWLVVEPGILRSLLFNTMVISGVSTLLVNGNPLLRFDGYHVLCDVIEVPNLGKRGNAWWGEMLRVRLLGTVERNRIPLTMWERLWFALYPPAAFVYRVVISVTIALFVATSYFLVGVLLAIWSLALTLVWPALKTAHKAWTDARIRRAGGRAVAGAAGAAVLVLGMVFLVPLPHWAVVQGVVWLPEEAFLRAPVAGRIARAHLSQGAMAAPGDALFTLEAPELQARARIAEARHARASAQLAVARTRDRAEAVRLAERVAEAQAARDDAVAQLARLRLEAGLAGRLQLQGGLSPEGRFLQRGALIGHLLPAAPPLVRVAVSQDLIGLVRAETRGIELRLASDTGRTHAARLLREVPAGSDLLPSPVLALEGGGPFAARQAEDGQGLRGVAPLFQFDLALADPPARMAYGMRAHVRLHFEAKPLALRAARALRRLFLTSFDV